MARGKKKETLTSEERLKAALVPESEQPYKVPWNWCWCFLGNIAFIRRGASPRPIKTYVTEDEAGVNWIKIGDTSGGKYISHVNEKITEEGAKKSVFVKEGTLLLSNSMSFGHPYILKVKGCIHDGWLALTPSEVINKEYLYYALLTSEWYFEQVAVGTAVRNLNSERVAGTPTPLPPLLEQQRIVDRIESLFAKLDEAKQKAQDALDSFEPRKAAILHKAFTGELTAQWRKEHSVGMESWEARTSTQLFEYVTSGSRGWAKYYADSGDIFVRMGNLNHGTIELDLSDIQYVKLPGQTEGQRTKLQKNDILISITADIGMVGIVREMEQNAYINQHIALARPTAKDNAEFLAWYLISDVGLQQMRNKQRGATKIGLGLDDIRSLELLIPTREEQDEVVYILDNLLAKEQQAKKAAEGVLEQIDLIKKAILARAFRGELGTNDPSEESAEELLSSRI